MNKIAANKQLLLNKMQVKITKMFQLLQKISNNKKQKTNQNNKQIKTKDKTMTLKCVPRI